MPDIKLFPVEVINYAIQQNRIPILPRLVTESERLISNVTLSITTKPAVILPFTDVIDLPEGTAERTDIKLLCDPEMLGSLTEKVSCVLHASLTDSDGNELCACDTETAVLAFDQWQGIGVYPELIASFCTPNNPGIITLTQCAQQYMKQWTGDPSLGAYYSHDNNRILTQAAAVYQALCDQKITYSVMPASCEMKGQRIRTADTVLSRKQGNCIELSLIYTACLEAIGLHPLLIVTKDHAFAGVWLEEKQFPEAVNDDPSIITKRMADGISELTVVECTTCVDGRMSPFDAAVQIARGNMAKTDDIVAIIDIKRARLSGISPLPERTETENGYRIVLPEQTPEEAHAPTELPDTIRITEGGEPVSKQLLWERRLLDLGLRNALINLRPSKTLVPVLSPSVDRLEDEISSGTEFQVYPHPAEYEEKEGVLFDTLHELGSLRPVIESEFSHRRLRSSLNDAALNRVIKELYRSSRTSLEENGANTLYLAMGLLRWYETDRSQKPRYAPVILLPMELTRKKAGAVYTLRLRDEEPQMNITLLEKLRQDFGINISGLDPLPQDESGVDTRVVFTALRQAVKEKKRWDVLESSYLGIFSFTQFVMWNDLRERADDLARSPVVRSLMQGKLCWDAEDMHFTGQVPQEGVYLPLSADASQLYAIRAAADGVSFVLHGPPGTGKSQTITSLIANALASGKTVLFVAEKMAALEVVQKRLKQIGLDPFCLELHSNKAKKRSVLEQLKVASEVTAAKSADEYAIRAAQISLQRVELDKYVLALHDVQPCGVSLYQLIERYSDTENARELPDLPESTVAEMTEAKMADDVALIERLCAAGDVIGIADEHPLRFVKTVNYTQTLRHSIAPVIASLKSSLARLDSQNGKLCELAGIPKAEDTSALSMLGCAASALLIVSGLPDKWYEMLTDASWFSALERKLDELEGLEKHIDADKQKLLGSWRTTFLDLNAESLLARYHQLDSKWLISRAIATASFVNELRPYSLTPRDIGDVGKALESLQSYRLEKQTFEKKLTEIAPSLGRLYEGSATDWQKLREHITAVRTQVPYLSAYPDALEMLKKLGPRTDCSEVYISFKNELENAGKLLDTLNDLLDIRTKDNRISTLVSVLDTLEADTNLLHDIIIYNGIESEVLNAGLTTVAEAMAKEKWTKEDILASFRRSVSRSLIIKGLDGSEVLNRFSGTMFNSLIDQFRRMDDELEKLTREEIVCRLSARVPDITREAAQSSEVAILRRAIHSNGRGISIRKLFSQIPTLLERLCPCMLMSPLSAAQYLSCTGDPFDIVVFDEASQLQTCKAIGPLARGKSAVIVGDPKQMPPTTFFASNRIDEDNIEIEDLESILDDCLTISMPQTHLLWHYRSRHESLIAFSNSRFYENKLCTFPSADDLRSRVRLIPVKGTFDRGKTRCNEEEAKAVVQELKCRCHSAEEKKLSVGVVTFNIMQQNLIEDLLLEECGKDEALEKWAYGSSEPIFIKNLENVQGDERDVILFSVGYGPDKTGRVSMNFGPLNRDGGWRRLNVAVSRARCEMLIFSGIEPEQIVQTKSEGVAALRAFLQYAREGARLKTSSEAAHGICAAIAEMLKANGYETRANVGRSDFRIDLAVIDPKQSEKYILGILLDGESYAATHTTRDREKGQTGVLEGLGWHLHRVWSVDWWDDSKREMDRILEKLHELENMPEPQPEEEEDELEEETALIPEETELDQIPVEEGENTCLYTPFAEVTPLNSEQFLSDDNRLLIVNRIRAILNAEAPITDEYLTVRLRQSFGLARLTPKTSARIEELLGLFTHNLTQVCGQAVYFSDEQQSEAYDSFRSFDSEDNRRDGKYLPVIECVNAMKHVIRRQISLAEADLIREAAAVMGYKRMTGAVKTAMEAAAGFAKENGIFVLTQNDTLTMNEEEE